MTKLRITFAKIRCVEVTTPHNYDDEAYFVVAPVAIRATAAGENPQQAQLPGAISTVRECVTKGTEYVPNLLKAKNSYEIPVENADAVTIAISMCERDDGGLYNRLRSDPHFKIPPNFKIQWKDILIIMPPDVKDVSAWLTNLANFAIGVVKGVLADDHIQTQTISFPLKEFTTTTKELKFRGDGAEYHMEVKIESV